MKAPTACIVGGGIGGLSAALELRRIGFDVVVYERRPELGEVDTGFLLWSFAIKRLRSLGLGAGLNSIGEPLERLVTVSRTGQMLSDLSLGRLSAKAGAPSHDVHRAGLQRLLADALGRDAIRLGSRCVDVQQDSSRATVKLENGESVATDLVVGADGVNSIVREQIVGRVELAREGAGIWRGVAQIGTHLIPSGHHLRIMGPAGLFGVGRLDRSLVRWYAGAPAPDPPPSDPHSRFDRLRDRFGDWPEPARSVIEATPAEAVLYNDAPHAKPLRSWHSDRVALLGDAAHPTLPTLATGGGMAIEDAGVLAECLAANHHVPSALGEYQRRRRRATVRVHWGSLAFAGMLALQNRFLVALRDLGFRFDPVQLWAIRRLMVGG